ncbi:hypothetical protein [Streptomyces silvensis]|uniref:Uncharacterized protein n=1 Tax=Streptomyces silvensis TaxID=1765722 RepID=A0A0W7X7T2_9ACTN|nr:hypothetical protein [Streptomyces silvensis]KUF18859.1 hypothetical protein AT728_07445 [Streptomyces silvensis]
MQIYDYLSDLTLRAYCRLQVFAAQEPVRLRAALTSLFMAGALFIPALASGDVAQSLGTLGAVVLPILVGESTRAKVSPQP